MRGKPNGDWGLQQPSKLCARSSILLLRSKFPARCYRGFLPPEQQGSQFDSKFIPPLVVFQTLVYEAGRRRSIRLGGAKIVTDGQEGPTVKGKPRVATERRNGGHYKLWV